MTNLLDLKGMEVDLSLPMFSQLHLTQLTLNYSKNNTLYHTTCRQGMQANRTLFYHYTVCSPKKSEQSVKIVVQHSYVYGMMGLNLEG